MTAVQLAEMLRRRGYVPEASIGVFEGTRVVAFTLNGLGNWHGVRTGYDSGTGVVRSHRGRGLSRKMLDASSDLLSRQGALQYLLEVLQSNDQAFGVYRKAGFEIVRELQCWALMQGESLPTPRVERIDDPDWELVRQFFDVEPSWQNSIESVRRAAAPRTCLASQSAGRLAGFAVVFDSGDLPILAVAPAMRRRGIGRELIAAASRTAGVTLRIVNVEGDYGAGFLEACGAVRTVRQFEMLRQNAS